jgi:hypothetical protein
VQRVITAAGGVGPSPGDLAIVAAGAVLLSTSIVAARAASR